ncbi:MAG: DNA-protecting protein DprA [Actinobacteria bacterium]|nr:DNA-protecting protein DprA [Actinomycetota bacterium]MCL5446924.1 DNA-protecting protein DprA [Actinomycetota bacterium]
MDETRVAAAALASLPGITPARLKMLMGGFDPEEAVERVHGGQHPADPQGRWMGLCGQDRMAALGERCLETAVDIQVFGMDGYPPSLSNDPIAPAVLFIGGRKERLGDVSNASMVCTVGTRAASPYGMKVAYEVGKELATAGIPVVSGLADGIDSAVHRGVLEAFPGEPSPATGISAHTGHIIHAALPVAVVAGGPDVAYPRESGDLFDAVWDAGVIISEVPPGGKAQRWRFVARNRIMAALSDVVIVVESHTSGGSLHTAGYALRRGKPVGAVPGPINSPASSGSNELIRSGKARLVRGVVDIVSLLEAGSSVPGSRNKSKKKRKKIVVVQSGGAAGETCAAGAPDMTVNAVEPASVQDVEVHKGPVFAPAADQKGTKANAFEGIGCIVPESAPATGQDGSSESLVPARSDGLGGDQNLRFIVLGQLGFQPLTLEEVVVLSGRPVGKVSLCLELLADEGLAREQAGSWTRR